MCKTFLKAACRASFKAQKKPNITNITNIFKQRTKKSKIFVRAIINMKPPTSEKRPTKRRKAQGGRNSFFQGSQAENRADRLQAHRSPSKAAVGAFILRG